MKKNVRWESMVDAYPLSWPAGWPRTEPQNRQRSRFNERLQSSQRGITQKDVSMSKARYGLLNELRLLGANNGIINSNIKTRLDGLPYSNQKQPDDVGVAIYFNLEGHDVCFPCDKWDRVEDNLYAVAKIINAMRGIERWGPKEMVAASFRGFDALPPHSSDNPDTVFAKPGIDHFAGCETRQAVKDRRRNLALDLHPDKGGDPDEFAEMMKQYDQMLKKVEN